MIVLTFQACSSSFRTHSFVCFVWRYEVFWCAITASCHTCSSISTPKWPLRFQPTSSRPARGSNAPSSSLAGLQLLQKQTVVGKQEQVLKVMRAKTLRWVRESPVATETHPRDGNKRQVNSHTERFTGQWLHRACGCVFSEVLRKSHVQSVRKQLCDNWLEFWFEVNLFKTVYMGVWDFPKQTGLCYERQDNNLQPFLSLQCFDYGG